MEELLIGVNTPIHLSEAGEELIEDVVEENEAVKTRRCQPLLPLETSTHNLLFLIQCYSVSDDAKDILEKVSDDGDDVVAKFVCLFVRQHFCH